MLDVIIKKKGPHMNMRGNRYIHMLQNLMISAHVAGCLEVTQTVVGVSDRRKFDRNTQISEQIEVDLVGKQRTP